MADRGLIGVCDILGYRKIASSANIEDVATLIRNVLQCLPDRVYEQLDSGVAEHSRETMRDLTRGLKYLVFSDTILVALPLDRDATERAKDAAWFYFLTFMTFLMRDSFDDGLPMRGAASIGEHIIIDSCFAGQPIVEAFELAHELEFAGAALTKGARSELRDVVRNCGTIEHFRTLLFPYAAPLKGDETTNLLLLNWFQGCHSKESPAPRDVHQYVVDAFEAHGKTISQDVLPKLENTELAMRHKAAPDWAL